MSINYNMNKVSFSVLEGKILTKILRKRDGIDFVCSNGEKYRMGHRQSCCEQVYIESIVGRLKDLLHNPILKAEEATSDKNPQDDDKSFTWTFYKLATIKGYVDIRWYGSSNGYYSESVDLYEIKPE